MTTTFIVSSLLLFAVLVFLIFWYFLSPDVRYNKNEAEQQKKSDRGRGCGIARGSGDAARKGQESPEAYRREGTHHPHTEPPRLF